MNEYIGKGDHEHRWFPLESKTAFEPKHLGNLEGEVIYTRVEYVLMTCNCGAAVKSKVEQQ